MCTYKCILHPKILIAQATIAKIFTKKTLCYPLKCFFKCLPNKKYSLHKLQFRTHSYHKLYASLSCVFTTDFQTKSIHYTSYNSGHILIINFMLPSHVLLQLSSKQKVFITQVTIPDTFLS